MTIEERAKELENTIEYCPVGDEYQALLKALQAERDDMREQAAQKVLELGTGVALKALAQEIRDLK